MCVWGVYPGSDDHISACECVCVQGMGGHMHFPLTCHVSHWA